MKRIKVLALSAIATGLLFSCQNENITTSDVEIKEISSITPEFLAKLDAIDINTKFVKEIEVTKLDGSVEKQLMLDDDIIMPYSKIQEMFAYYDRQFKSSKTSKKQYVTPDRVRQGITISVYGFTGSGVNQLTADARQTLGWAVDNLNAAQTNLTFTLDFGTDYEDADIVVYRDPNSPRPGTLASAGFPTNGRPFNEVKLYPLLDTRSGNYLEATIVHELGHCVGFRHTDWFSRESCSNVPDPEPRLGAILVPGTPRGYDPGSIMRACVNPRTDGEFNNNDIIALRAMYPR